MIREFYYSQLKQCFLAFQLTSQLSYFTSLSFCRVKGICDFHREKAWLEWTSKSDNGVASIKETILDLLRKVAHAVTTTDSAAAVKNLQNSKFWNDNEKLRKWFGKKWLPNIEVNLLDLISSSTCTCRFNLFM